MKYLADILTALRIALAFVIFVCILQQAWAVALVLFAVAALTDAFDGMCARRWPYSPEDVQRLWWRRKFDAQQIDNVPDGTMIFLAVLALAWQFDYWRVLAVVIYAIAALLMWAVSFSIRKGYVWLAEAADVLAGLVFVTNITLVVWELASRNNIPLTVFAVGVMVGLLFLLVFKRDKVFERPDTRRAAEEVRYGRP